MNKEATGIVLEIIDTIAKVKVNRHGECSNCGACPGDSAMVLDVKNKMCAKPGQRVIVEIPEVNVIKAAFIVYLLPIITTASGFLIGLFIANISGINSTIMEIISSIAFLILSIVIIKRFDKSAQSGDASQPKIIKVFN